MNHGCKSVQMSMGLCIGTVTVVKVTLLKKGKGLINEICTTLKTMRGALFEV